MANEDFMTTAAAQSAALKSFSNVFVELIGQLTEKGLDPLEASEYSLDLVKSYMNYANGIRFADNSEVVFVAEEEA
jgi:hypothetical protein